MNHHNHYFSPLEQKYYNYYLYRRKIISEPFVNSILIKEGLDHHVGLLRDCGHVELTPEYSNIKKDFEPVKKQIIDHYSESQIRVLSNPFNINGLFELIKKYLVPFSYLYYGCIPTIGYIKIIKSYTLSSAKDTQFFHRDPGSYNLLKAIIYVSDVDSDSGPLVYVGGSNKDNLIGVSGRDRVSDSHIQERYENCINEITGPSGQISFFNARGIHKGKLPVKNDRVAIIVNFSLHSEYGQKDNYSKITYQMNNRYSEYDLMLLDSCMPIFGVENDKS